MIHAYFFMEKGSEEREEHGKNFISMMEEINKKEQSKITVYHNFLEEVDYYRTHHWECEKCKLLIKRSMNRAPSKNDYWWDNHFKNCGSAVFFKIKEPQKDPKKNSKRKNKNNSKISSQKNTLDTWVLKKNKK